MSSFNSCKHGNFLAFASLQSFQSLKIMKKEGDGSSLSPVLILNHYVIMYVVTHNRRVAVAVASAE